MAEDYYNILGVDKNATTEEIKKAYKQLAKKHHPDLNGHGGDADADKFKEISNAYSTLSNSEKRKQYDTFGSSGPGASAGAQGFSGFSGFGGGQGFSGFDFSDIFNSFSGFSDDREDDLFSRFTGRRQRPRSRENLDLVYKINIDFETAVKGRKQNITIERDEECTNCSGTGSKNMNKHTCETCGGRGKVINTKRTPFGMFSVETICPKCRGVGTIIKDPCSDCSGKGYVRSRKEITINIPAGINENDVIRLKDQGHNHTHNKGDLFINVKIEVHDFFKRDGKDIYCELPMVYTDLVLGTSIRLNKFGDRIKLKIPSNTKTNTIFRLKGHGLPDVNRRSGNGSLYVKVITEIPSKISSEYKKKLKDLVDCEEKTIKKDIFKKYKDYIS